MVNENDRSARESSIASGWTVEGQPEAAPAKVRAADEAGDPRPDEDGAPERRELSSGALVLLGLIGGVYLLYTYVWFSWANAASVANAAVVETSGSLGGVLQQLVFWVAPCAPALWFVSVLVLCRGQRVWRMTVWLALGLLVLVPLPMFGGMF